MVLSALSTPSLPDGSTYRGSSLTSLRLPAKGSEYSLATRRRVPERNSPNKRRNVGVRNSSSGPCVLSLSIEPNSKSLTSHFCRAAKVIPRWLRRSNARLSSPPVNNFGGTISAGASRALAQARQLKPWPTYGCSERGQLGRLDRRVLAG